jgi:hypothetical protein
MGVLAGDREILESQVALSMLSPSSSTGLKPSRADSKQLNSYTAMLTVRAEILRVYTSF